MNAVHRSRLRALAATVALTSLMAACGGGGGGGGSTVEPPKPPQGTALPDQVTLTALAATEIGVEQSFGNSVSGLTGLTFAWDFGDGSTSAEPSPKHAYAKTGDFAVKFKVTNAAGTFREATQTVVVNSLAHVRNLSCSGANSSGWCWQTPRVGERFNGVALLSASLGWAAGADGQLFKTTDGGSSWTAGFKAAGKSFVSINFVDAQVGAALAKDGTLYLTTDGGTQWAAKSMAPGFNSTGLGQTLDLLDSRRIVVRRSGLAAASSDGGTTWLSVAKTVATARPSSALWAPDGRYTDLGQAYQAYGPTPTTREPWESSGPGWYFWTDDLTAVDELTAVRVQWADQPISNGPDLRAVLRTFDGGQTWERIAIKEDGVRLSRSRISPATERPIYYPTLLVPTNGRVLWALGSTVYRSTDGGANWTQAVVAGGAPTGIRVEGWADRSNPARLLTVYRQFGETLGVLYETLDEGKTWTKTGLAEAGIGVTRILSGEAGRVVVEANNGAQYRRDDATGRWVRIANADDLGSITALGFWDGQTGKGLATTSGSGLLATDDGGRNWRVQQLGDLSAFFFPANYRSKLQVFGSKAWTARNGNVYFSDNRGDTWTEKGRAQFGAAHVWTAHFRDANNGDVVLDAGYLMRTTDGGATWTRTGNAVLSNDIQFVNDQLGLINIEKAGISVTRDGGATWSNVVIPTAQFYFKQMLMVDANEWWVVGYLAAPVVGYVHVTRDGGQTWTEHKLPGKDWPALRAVGVAADGQPWIAGDGGALFTTTDRGATWQDRSLTTGSSLSAIHFNSSKTGWLGGTRGEVVSTGTGGR
ncbi:PKD domain-containing protein [Pelomonas sp. SE-A7]|uniref:PKD domain-containing protein n=1 Tax=Pelomonas sp. SE-A7 TaxID=3054953 RepID=UPI00259D0FF7|nr:PKD domain-containing protein [Pelomonas sp. SE-A7]MDM4768394.1 PKD domain-containing protein [Pelomonas sp. SE-A7]